MDKLSISAQNNPLYINFIDFFKQITILQVMIQKSQLHISDNICRIVVLIFL